MNLQRKATEVAHRVKIAAMVMFVASLGGTLLLLVYAWVQSGAASPGWLTDPLRAVGVHPVWLLVELTIVVYGSVAVIVMADRAEDRR